MGKISDVNDTFLGVPAPISQEELGDRIQQEVKPGVDEIIKLGSSMEVRASILGKSPGGNFCGRYLLGAC